MGAYLSKPVTEKNSSDESNESVVCGVSTMQGWRVDQEDAHNIVLDFDEKCSLFAVYDGHGGHEVATYAALHLPDFIKKSDLYVKSEFSQSLIDSFLEFDASLVKPEVLSVLEKLSGTVESEDSDYDGGEVDHLWREAAMPLEEVMAKYTDESNQFISPIFNRHRKLLKEKFNSSSSSSTGESSFPVSRHPSCPSFDSPSSSKTTCELSQVDKNNGEKAEESFVTKENIIDSSSSTQAKNGIELKDDVNTLSNTHNGFSSNADDGSGGAKTEAEVSAESKTPTKVMVNGESPKVNGIKKASGMDEESKSPSTEHHSSEVSAGDGIKSSEGVAEVASSSNAVKKDRDAHTEEGVEATTSTGSRSEKVLQCGGNRKPRLAAQKFYKSIQSGVIAPFEDTFSDEEDSEDEDSDEETIEDGLEDEASSSDDLEEDIDEEDDSDEEITSFHDNCSVSSMKTMSKCGYDSGCTACVALLKGSELYVANVGDSRCVVCRDGQALDMSVDHKPEDELESARVVKAGGLITEDGRVNGGLNLSRALGDHNYKQNKSIRPEEQMISALPDVRSLTLTEEDAFMVIACDGIWNSMSSQEVCDFVSARLESQPKLSVIAEEIFDACLSPDASGDGTGCDNMTCVIVKFSGDLSRDDVAVKRCLSSDDERPEKKPRLNHDIPVPDVSS